MAEFRITHLDGTDIQARAHRATEAFGLLALERYDPGRRGWRPVLRLPVADVHRLNGVSLKTYFADPSSRTRHRRVHPSEES